jgi:hypothetical protein
MIRGPDEEATPPMRMRRTMVAATLLLSLTAAACTSNSSTAAGTDSPTTQPSTASPSLEPTPSESGSPSPSPTPEPVIEDGRHFVFVKKASDGSMTFDLAEFYTGDAANEIAGERGDEVPVPNDVYIVNDNPKLRTVPVADDAKIHVLKWSVCCDVIVTLTYDKFAGYVAHPTDDFHGTSSPYWIRVQGGEIVKIDEQYLP